MLTARIAFNEGEPGVQCERVRSRKSLHSFSGVHTDYLLSSIGHFRVAVSRFRSESWCSTILREMSLICIRIPNSFPFEWLCTRTRFETEVSSNSEMAYLKSRPFFFQSLEALPVGGPRPLTISK